MAAFASRHRYDLAYRDARPWLYGIATNIIGSHRRDELRQFRIIQAVGSQAPSPGHADQVVSDVTARSISGHPRLRWPASRPATVTCSSSSRGRS